MVQERVPHEALAWLYSPLSGRIIIDDYDISKVDLSSLRRQVGIVPQDSLFLKEQLLKISL